MAHLRTTGIAKEKPSNGAAHVGAFTKGDLGAMIQNFRDDKALALGALRPNLPDHVDVITERKRDQPQCDQRGGGGLRISGQPAVAPANNHPVPRPTCVRSAARDSAPLTMVAHYLAFRKPGAVHSFSVPVSVVTELAVSNPGTVDLWILCPHTSPGRAGPVAFNHCEKGDPGCHAPRVTHRTVRVRRP